MTEISVGTIIKIGRSDGRIHDAVISIINLNARTVSVEWKEADEVKGKEIDLVSVYQLNPYLTPIAGTASLAGRSGFGGRARTMAGAHPNRTASECCSRTSRSLLLETSSRVVRNVSRIETNRIERRKKLVELKAEKDVLSRKVADNPNFQLLSMVADYRQTLQMLPITGEGYAEDRLITVCVRKRPMNGEERHKKAVDIVTVPSENQLIIHEPKTKVNLTKYLDNHLFKFDYTFNEDCDNRIVYSYTAEPLIKTIFEGGFATCFAYGQTGSGKTFTMSGDTARNVQGIYAMVATDVFHLVRTAKYAHLKLTITCSFFEIYSKKVLDLLNRKAALKILEDGRQQVQIVGLTERVVKSVEDVLELIEVGCTARTSGQTSANLHSSRSHAIFQLNLKKLTQLNALYGKFSLIDLAGNERGADTISSDKVTRLEGGEINKSLLALKECIRALGRKGSHRPFRLSKLTQVLRDSFVGSNSRTCMIATISPAMNCCENTLNTLRYADRVKELSAGEVAHMRAAAPDDEAVHHLTDIREDDAEILDSVEDEGDEDAVEDEDDEEEADGEETTRPSGSMDEEDDDGNYRTLATLSTSRCSGTKGGTKFSVSGANNVFAFHKNVLRRLEQTTADWSEIVRCGACDPQLHYARFDQILDGLQTFVLNARNYVVQYK